MTNFSLKPVAVIALSLSLAAIKIGAAQIEVASRKVAIPENGFTSEIVIHAAPIEVALIPPPQWRMTIDTNATTLTWQTLDFHTMLRLRIVTGPGDAAAVAEESLRERVRTDFPEAEIRDAAECYTATHKGMGFELEERKTRFPTVTRLAFLPLDGGRLELQLTCPLEESKNARHRLTSVMNSLRITVP